MRPISAFVVAATLVVACQVALPVNAWVPLSGRSQSASQRRTTSWSALTHHQISWQRRRWNDCSSSVTASSSLKMTPFSTNLLENTSNIRTKSLLVTSMSLVSLLLVIWKRDAILAFLGFVKNKWLLTTLNRLSEAGLTGLIVYTMVFLLWEMTFGITTPVETAAGMAFGAIPGIVASGLGKFLGALLAFLLARYKFTEPVRKRMESNELLSLMEESIQERPFRVALLCRFSPLPEFVKNAGIGVLPVPMKWFILSLILHGFSFTCLWTCMGAETARVLRGMEPSSTLKVLISGATWIGCIAPIMIALWIKNLKDMQKERRERELKEFQ